MVQLICIYRDRRRRKDRKLKARFTKLLRVRFTVIFDVDVELDEDSVEIIVVDEQDESNTKLLVYNIFKHNRV